MDRIDVRYNGELIPLTPLTSRVLARSGQTVEIAECHDGPIAGGPKNGADGNDNAINGTTLNGESTLTSLNWEETVLAKQQLIDNWDKLTGEEVLAKLESIWSNGKKTTPRADLAQNLDLWLLKALALDKTVCVNRDELEDTYQHCRHLGKWNGVLIRNNLAVLKAIQNNCLESLDLLTDAVQLALNNDIKIKAPFFNAALLLHHLHKNGLIFERKYLSIAANLSSIVATGGGASTNASDSVNGNDVPNNGELTPSEQHTDLAPTEASISQDSLPNVRAIYTALARIGEKTKETKFPDVFQKAFAYMSPRLDLFDSFGDVTDKIDSRTAHQFFEKANEFASQEKFALALKSAEMGGRHDPTRSSEASALTEKLLEQWRQHENQRMTQALDHEEFDQASSVILNLADDRLRQPIDDQTLADIKVLDHLTRIRKGNELREVDPNESRLIFLGLLKDPSLNDSLRIYVSSRLAEPLKDLEDDAERHQALKELILCSLHPNVIDRVAGELETLLVKQAQSFTQAEDFERALEKYFWALLLPERRYRREALMQSALFVAEFLGNPSDFNALGRLANPNFAELKAELQERWENSRNAELISKFEKLDGERWLSRKQIDELMGLLDELIANEPSPERLVARLRLPREKEAQQTFTRIVAELQTISKEGNHSKRRDSILGELRLLQDLAIDLGAGDHTEYAKDITNFVLKTESYLLQADNERLKHEISIAASREIETDFERFKNTLLETDPLKVLTNVGSILIATQGTDISQQASDLSLHWLEQSGKMSYRRIFAQHPEQARQIIRQTHDVIARHQSVLPQQFQDQLQGLLREFESQFEPQVEPDPRPRQPPPFSPPPTRRSRWHNFKGWLKTKLNRGESS